MGPQEIIALSDRYLMRTYGRAPVVPVRGAGARLWDASGREYLDFTAGVAVCSLGHCHPRVVAAVRQQAARLMHCSNLYYIEQQARLAALLAEHSGLERVFFCNSGAEAVEGAIKLARKWAKIRKGKENYEIITAFNSFHGRTLACITATGQLKYQKGFEPLPRGFRYVPFNDLSALEDAVNDHTCAVMLEPVQGEGGVNVAGGDYLRGVRELCDRAGLLLIFDEVQCGLGRTGRLFAHQHYGVKPDVMTLAKALGGGFPIGALLAREEVARAFEPGDHASTFGGNPLACAAGLAALQATLEEDLAANAARMGEYLRERLWELASRYPFVREVRGLGLMVGIELTEPGAPFVERCREKGLLINCVNGYVLRLVPPLTITEQEVDEAARVLDEVFKEAMKEGEGRH
ncbi:MAG: acetylornithine transaminase [Desulfotomaculales bacterium]